MMNKEEIKIIAVFTIFGSILFSSLAFANFYMTKVQGSLIMENRRINAEKEDIIKIKCQDPRVEFLAKESEYLKKYNLLSDASARYDILSKDSSSSSTQFSNATSLKIDEDLVTSGCQEAREEIKTMTDTDQWTYFKSNWKKMMFNKE